MQVTVEIRALLEEGEYASLGAAGDGPPGEGMTGADLAVVWYDGRSQRPEVECGSVECVRTLYSTYLLYVCVCVTGAGLQRDRADTLHAGVGGVEGSVS